MVNFVLFKQNNIIMENTTVFIGGRKHIEPDEVVCLKADINYTTVHFKEGKKTIVATTLKTIEQRLENYPNFYRITKSTIINIDCVHAVKDNNIYMPNGEVINPSRRRAKAFYQLFDNVG